MKLRKIILCLLIISMLVLPLSACSNSNETVNVKPQQMNTVSSGVVDENDNFVLEWNGEQNCVLLKSKTNSSVWSTVPYDFYLQNETNINLNAPLFITYYNPADGSLMTAKAFADCIEMNNLSVSRQDGTVRMEFYFEDAEVLIPLVISLDQNGLKATVKAEEIKESGKTRLISVSVLPYFCSTPNAQDKSNYLFVPVGSGALMYTDEDVQEFSRTYTGEVYGEDKARHLLDNTTDEEAIRLPVYGVKYGSEALFAIIESGAESASVTADAGNSKNGYSTVYSTFAVRGYDETEVERTGYSDALIYAEEYNKNAVYTVGFYPLSGEDADYNGMARYYKKYLAEKKELNGKEPTQKNYQLSFLGGSLVRDVAVGIPYMRMQTATTLSQAKTIVEQLSQEVGEPAVILKGYTDDGLGVGRIAGGYSLSSKLGGKKDYKTLKEYCTQNNIPLYTEFDLVQFNSSADGFSTNFDIAQTAGKQLAAFYPLKKNIRYSDEELAKTALLQRSVLATAVEKLNRKTEYIGGLSIASLGSMAYSDYSNENCYAKGDMALQVQNLLKKISGEGHSINTNSANGYAAAVSDSVSDVPLTNGEYFALDETVPFYQMIFKGTTALYSTPVNLAEDAMSLLLRAVESGVSPAYTLTYERSTDLADTQSKEYYGSLYLGNKENIINWTSKTADFYEKVGASEIKSHKIINKAVTETVFSNGTSVLVNHGETSVSVGGIEIQGKSFRFENGGTSYNCDLTGGGQ